MSLQELREALAKATPGEWTSYPPMQVGLYLGKSDAEFIVLLRNNAEALIESAEKIQLIEENACSIVTDHYLKALIEIAEAARRVLDAIYEEAVSSDEIYREMALRAALARLDQP